MYYHTCSGCKFNRKYIDSWNNWCHESTFPTGVIVRTKGECDKWEKGGLVIQPKPEKERTDPDSPRHTVPVRRRALRRKYALNREKAKTFFDKYFSG